MIGTTMAQPDYSNLQHLLNRIKAFNADRDWQQFHNPKDLALSLVLEAAELLEHFQWKSEQETKEHLEKNRRKVANELADVLYWVLLMCDYFQIDIVQALDHKMDENESKYPIHKAKGSHRKYTNL